MNAYFICDSEFMLSVSAGGNVKIYVPHGFYCNVKGDASQTGHTVESREERRCSE